METTPCLNQKIIKLLLNKDGEINPNTSRKSWWEKRNIETMYNHILSQTSFLEAPQWNERVYCFINNLSERPKCSVCDTSVKMFYNYTKGYGKTCSRKCNNLSSDRTQNIKNTYSNFTPEQKENHTKLVEEGFIKKYGMNVAKTEHFKTKYKEAMNEKYGVDNYFEMTDCVKESFNKKYGCDNPQQIPEVKQKTLKTVREKYGEMIGACPAEQTKKTCNKRYGSDHFFSSESGKMTEENLRERYGWTEDELLEWKKSRNSMSLEWAISRTNSIEEAQQLHSERIKAVTIHFGKASKESLKIFIPLYKILRKNKVSRKEIWFGIGGSKEKYIVDHNTNSMYFYDFCVETPSSKFIIEYNGVAFHPKSPLQEGWEHPFNSSRTTNKCYTHDQTKKQLAIDNGYSYLTLWSDVNKTENLKLAKEFVKELI